MTRDEALSEINSGSAHWAMRDGTIMTEAQISEFGRLCSTIVIRRGAHQSASSRASCSYNGGIPGRGSATPVMVIDQDTESAMFGFPLGPKLRRDGRPVMERRLDQAQTLSLSPRNMKALAFHLARETSAVGRVVVRAVA